jgi:filamentous hemagglutinin family protein
MKLETNNYIWCLYRILAIVALVYGASFSPFAHADATTDGSVGAVQTLTGSFTVPQSLGTVVGNNLFHSFLRFGIGVNETATFTTSSSSLQNVISRVTGGEQSPINGTLKLDAAAGSRPDFFFINPAGVMFGAGAQIDVPAGFHVSTARTLSFADGFAWDTANATTSSLTITAPESFGFVGGSSAAAVIFNNLDASGTPDLSPNIEMRSGSNLNIVAGDVKFDTVVLSVPEGTVRVIAVGDQAVNVPRAGEVGVPLNGSIQTNATSFFTTESGSMLFDGGRTTLSTSSISSNNVGNFSAGPISLIGGDVVVRESRIVTSASGSGNAGDIDVRAQSLTVDGNGVFAAIDTEVTDIGTGRSGNVKFILTGELALQNIAQLSSSAPVQGTAGDIDIQAGSMTIDGRGIFAGILSIQGATNSGVNRGGIKLSVVNNLKMQDAAIITSSTFTSATAGPIDISAGSIIVDGKDTFASITSGTSAIDGGNAGTIGIRAMDGIFLYKGAEISANTFGAGKAGDIRLSGRTLTIDGQGIPTLIASKSSGDQTGNAGTINVTATEDISIRDGGAISVVTGGMGDAGRISVRSDSLLIEEFSAPEFVFTGLDAGQSNFLGTGNVGAINIVTTSHLSIFKGGELALNNSGSGTGGEIDIHARSMVLDGGGQLARISTQAFGMGDAGSIKIKVDDALSIKNRGKIFSNTNGLGAAGAIAIETGSLTAAGPSPETGISATTFFGSGGQTGPVTILARDVISLSDHASFRIENNAVVTDPALLRPAMLSIRVPRLSLISNARISAETSGNVAASGIHLESIGLGGALFVTSDVTGEITTSTRMPTLVELGDMSLSGPLPEHGSGKAGNIEFRAGELTLSGVRITSQAKPGTSGEAGRVAIAVEENLSIGDSGLVTTDTFGSGTAGNISINARNATFDAGQVTSNAGAGALGSAGSVTISIVENLDLINGARISTSTESVGVGGTIDIRARNVSVAGMDTAVQAKAGAVSSGQIGNLKIVASDIVRLNDGASLSIQNDASQTEFSLAPVQFSAIRPLTVSPGTLSVTASSIVVDGGQVSALSSGNIASGNLRLSANQRLTLRNAALTTRAQDGDGGGIDIVTGGMLLMDHSQVTTSVLGRSNGNGGDIRVRAGTLLMDTGFIQANTNALQAIGGNIDVDVGLLVAAGALLLGGDEPFTFDPGLTGVNVIQAASSDGVSGNVNVSGPIVDTAGNLRNLSSNLENPKFESDLCRRSASSTFTSVGRGGLALRATGWLRAEDSASPAAEGPRQAVLAGSITCR